jgi:CRP-like cAMP-binding protein
MDSQIPHENLVLARLPAPTLDRLLAHARLTDHDQREMVIHKGEPVRVLQFPIEGMVSMVSVNGHGAAVEVVTVGREGVVGVGALFHDTPSTFDFMWQLPGRAVVVGMDHARSVLASEPALSGHLARYLASLFVQGSQNGACNRLHDLEERAAKWLLLTRDRVGSDDVALTQDYFALMLGVTRPKLSLVESILRRAGLVDGRRRGMIRILDRAGLEEQACDCYGIISRELASLDGV